MHLTGKCILRALKMAQVCSQCSSNHRYCGTIYSIRVGAYVLSMKSVENRSVKIQHTNVMLLSAIFRIYLFTVNHALIVCSCLSQPIFIVSHSLCICWLVGVCVITASDFQVKHHFHIFIFNGFSHFIAYRFSSFMLN